MKYLILILYVSYSVLGNAQKSLPPEVLKSIQDRIANGHSPSIVVGIIDKDGPQYYLFGNKTLEGKPVNEHTIYEIGSISKTFTGILLAQMVLKKKVKLDDPVQKYLPDSVKLRVQNGKKISLGHLSDHTSGLPRMPSNFTPSDPSNPYADYSVEQLYAFLNSISLSRDIGSAYEYSNLAQGLLGHVLAIKAGLSYEALLIRQIATPLGMNETKITFDEHMIQNLAMGHSHGTQVSNWDLPTLAGAGAIRSSLHDMLLYIAANAGLKKNKLYPAMQLSHQARHDKAGQGIQVGLGWHISKGALGDLLWHSGGTGGYRTFAGFIEKIGKGVVVLTNSDKGADDIGRYLLDPDTKLIEVKKSAANAIKKVIDSNGADAGWIYYDSMKKSIKSDYDLNEEDINTLGYTYLQSDKIKEAIVLFKINVAEFPHSSNVYDSYGEGLMSDGQQNLAIENYQKSLEINPGNSNATEMLTKMGKSTTTKIVTIDKAILASYVGTYQLAPNFNIVITHEDKHLYGQATGQSRFELFAKSETEFYLKIVEARITFTVNNGKVESLTLFQGGQVLPGKRLD